MEKDFSYFNQCDKFRTKYKNGEDLWQEMMKNKIKIEDSTFFAKCDISKLMDEDDDISPEDFFNDERRQDPDFGVYKSSMDGKDCMFYQAAGFEFIFMDENDFPQKIIDNNIDENIVAKEATSLNEDGSEIVEQSTGMKIN